jgi:alkylated DNA repair dioxygenase AlkB
MSIKGLTLHYNYITNEISDNLIKKIYDSEWNTSMSRRTQHYGYEYGYTNFNVTKTKPIPPVFSEVVKTIISPDQCIINEYTPGQGIAAHIDAAVFGPIICSLSLNSDCMMDFTHNDSKISINLPKNSLLVLEDEARYKWTHEIARRKNDVIDGIKRPRNTRISLTFRTIKIDF